jgi:hypothetical protein
MERGARPTEHDFSDSSGLHYYDPWCIDNFSFVSTVESNKLPFTKQQILGAEQAQNLYAGLGFPLNTDFKWMLRANQIKDCPVMLQDAEVADKIWGPNIAALKGKTTRKQPDPVVTDVIAVPSNLHNENRFIIMSMDVFFVNKPPFFLTLGRSIYFTTVTHLADQKAETIFKEFKKIFMLYLGRGFQIIKVLANGQFAPLSTMMYDLPGLMSTNHLSRGGSGL